MIARQEALKQNYIKFIRRWGLVALCGFIGGGGLAFYFDFDHNHELHWLENLFGIGMLSFIISLFLALFWFSKNQKKLLGVFCPNCHKEFVGVTAQIAIAAGKCGYCGVEVFSETDAKKG